MNMTDNLTNFYIGGSDGIDITQQTINTQQTISVGYHTLTNTDFTDITSPNLITTPNTIINNSVLQSTSMQDYQMIPVKIEVPKLQDTGFIGIDTGTNIGTSTGIDIGPRDYSIKSIKSIPFDYQDKLTKQEQKNADVKKEFFEELKTLDSTVEQCLNEMTKKPDPVQVERIRKALEDQKNEMMKKNEMTKNLGLVEQTRPKVFVSQTDKKAYFQGSNQDDLNPGPIPGKPKCEKEDKMSYQDEGDSPFNSPLNTHASMSSVSTNNIDIKSGQRWLFENTGYKLLFEIEKIELLFEIEKDVNVVVRVLQSDRNIYHEQIFNVGNKSNMNITAFRSSEWKYLEGQDRPQYE